VRKTSIRATTELTLFHSIRLARFVQFANGRVLTFFPPDGEFVVLNYRMTTEFRCPFKIFPHVEEVSPFKIEVTVTVRADMPDKNAGANVNIVIPLPKDAVSVFCEHQSSVPNVPGDKGAPQGERASLVTEE